MPSSVVDATCSVQFIRSGRGVASKAGRGRGPAVECGREHRHAGERLFVGACRRARCSSARGTRRRVSGRRRGRRSARGRASRADDDDLLVLAVQMRRHRVGDLPRSRSPARRAGSRSPPRLSTGRRAPSARRATPRGIARVRRRSSRARRGHRSRRSDDRARQAQGVERWTVRVHDRFLGGHGGERYQRGPGRARSAVRGRPDRGARDAAPMPGQRRPRRPSAQSGRGIGPFDAARVQGESRRRCRSLGSP